MLAEEFRSVAQLVHWHRLCFAESPSRRCWAVECFGLVDPPAKGRFSSNNQQETMTVNSTENARRGWLCLLSLCACATIGNAASAEPRPKSVRVVYLVSADRSVREDFREAIEKAVKE